VAAKVSQENSFKAVAETWLDMRADKLSPKTVKAARSRFKIWVYPRIGKMPVSSITRKNVLAMLRAIEKTGVNETAHRTRKLVDRVFKHAISEELASHNPTPDSDVLVPVKVKGFPAITDPKRVGELLRAIDGYDGNVSVALALKLAPLVFVRPGELRTAEWKDIDLEAKEWRIPAEKMKMGTAHVVPLSDQAAAILGDLHKVTGPKGLLFPSVRTDERPISDNTLNAALRRLGYAQDEMVVHGFRKTASTLLNELAYHPDVIEKQLAHRSRGVRAIYNKAQHMPERRQMMQAWADYLEGLKSGANVIPIHGAA